MSTLDRAFISFGITDEIFALASSTYERVGRNYMLGLILFLFLLDLRNIYWWFSDRTDARNITKRLRHCDLWHVFSHHYSSSQKLKNVRKVLIFSIILSCFFELIKPVIEISSGFVIILCTILAAGLGAYFFPVKEIEHE